MATYWDWPYYFNRLLLEETSGPDGTQEQWKIEHKIPSTCDGPHKVGKPQFQCLSLTNLENKVINQCFIGEKLSPIHRLNEE